MKNNFHRIFQMINNDKNYIKFYNKKINRFKNI